MSTPTVQAQRPPAFTLSPEQREFASTVRSFLDRYCSSEQIRKLFEEPMGFDPATWRLMSEQLGLSALAVPEKFGGAGATFTDLTIACEELGRSLVGSPFYATSVLATSAILAATTSGPDQDRWAGLLSDVAAGSQTATLALPGGSLTITPARPVLAEQTPDGWALTGGPLTAIDGASADVILAIANIEGRPALFAVDRGAQGLDRTPLTTLDLTRPQARIGFVSTPATVVGGPGTAEALLRRVASVASMLTAAEQLGGAQRCLDQAVLHAKSRIQFGRTIGSFQAVKHRLTDVHVDVELARSAVYHASWVADTTPEELDVAASMAALWTSQAYLNAAQENIQIHGGVGFTWEHDGHLHLRRALAGALMPLPAEYHRRMIADDLAASATGRTMAADSRRPQR